MSANRKPWMKFYPADWRADPRLRMCSLSARGLWADLISYMHEGEPYGHLTIDNKAPSDADLAALVGRPLREVKRALSELRDRSVFSITQDGVVYSRRMVRDKAQADIDIESGKRGGNPSLIERYNKGVNPPNKAQILEARSQKPESNPPLPSGVAPLSALSKEIQSSERPKPKRKTQVPEDWEPDNDGVKDAISEGFSLLEVEKMALQFRDDRRAKGVVYADLKAAWRTWVRNEVKFRKKAKGNGGGPNAEPEDKILRRIAFYEDKRREALKDFDQARADEFLTIIEADRARLSGAAEPATRA